MEKIWKCRDDGWKKHLTGGVKTGILLMVLGVALAIAGAGSGNAAEIDSLWWIWIPGAVIAGVGALTIGLNIMATGGYQVTWKPYVFARNKNWEYYVFYLDQIGEDGKPAEDYALHDSKAQRSSTEQKKLRMKIEKMDKDGMVNRILEKEEDWGSYAGKITTVLSVKQKLPAYQITCMVQFGDREPIKQIFEVDGTYEDLPELLTSMNA